MRRIQECFTGSTSETRSFNEIYGEDADKLFEDTDDTLIDPKFKKLFESVYDSKGKPHYERLRESCEFGEGINDCAHNKPGLEGSDPEVQQSGQDYDVTPHSTEGASAGPGPKFSESKKRVNKWRERGAESMSQHDSALREAANIGTDDWEEDEDGWDGEDADFGLIDGGATTHDAADDFEDEDDDWEDEYDDIDDRFSSSGDDFDEDASDDGFDTEDYEDEDEPDWDDGPSMSDDIDLDAEDEFGTSGGDEFDDDFEDDTFFDD
jgi:hypothetical protein